MRALTHLNALQLTSTYFNLPPATYCNNTSTYFNLLQQYINYFNVLQQCTTTYANLLQLTSTIHQLTSTYLSNVRKLTATYLNDTSTYCNLPQRPCALSLKNWLSPLLFALSLNEVTGSTSGTLIACRPMTGSSRLLFPDESLLEGAKDPTSPLLPTRNEACIDNEGPLIGVVLEGWGSRWRDARRGCDSSSCSYWRRNRSNGSL